MGTDKNSKSESLRGQAEKNFSEIGANAGEIVDKVTKVSDEIVHGVASTTSDIVRGVGNTTSDVIEKSLSKTGSILHKVANRLDHHSKNDG
ncbi:hypothetical protein [Sulfoacidibacillus ferrooxidans]|uniref:Uncharacterized protein n=1 Tax=Sulfoacidibacillus ferrooxidans TaxID=2005001 RepID=A0A9X1VAG7_9BACL|nr:hypothetical protein [Sulfoacidibacillus ferrooxidans]MCI0184641.1 hypothetical protein [Sulfoacidibacillus ferrooxidans]